ncbi:MAG TPA: ABC transporter permease [Miltoncostaeaceae bacterium]|nr:ABC transporter permease [Miltoncostaeaceae bacterium]
MGRGLAVSLGLIRRNLLLVRRMPSVFIPAMVMPLFILIATAGAFHGIGALPAFAGASYLAFTLPMAATMGGGFAGVNSGMTLARDLEYGFFSRLQASPAPRISLIAGPIGAAMVRSLFTSTVVFIAATAAGAPWPGLGNALIVYLLAMGFAACAACWATGVALRTKSVQAAPLMQVVVFISVFCSVAYTPRDALTGWLRHVADYNPVTRVLEASRAAELVGISWSKLWPGLVSLGVLLAVLLVFSLSGFRKLTTE